MTFSTTSVSNFHDSIPRLDGHGGLERLGDQAMGTGNMEVIGYAIYMRSSFVDFETANDPTGGYVNYVSQDYAQSQGLVSVEGDGSVLIRADSSKPATGRGRDSVRLSSKDEFADGVYILDVNHMPVGCGVWPAWWTTVKDGWPKGGEIDIIEGANALPKRDGTAWRATGNITIPQAQTTRNVASLHTSDNCLAEQGTYMTGTLEANTCSAFMNGNQGCGIKMGGNTTYGVESFGSDVNDINGGWYALWRDMSASGGAYVWFWPRNSPDVPDDVRNPATATTNVAGWGQPAANLTTSCKGDFSNHVIVFNIAFCGDYSAATYGISGCPTTQNCPTFVQATPQAFTETYWSINSLRVYNAQGRPVSGGSRLSKGAIAGIVVGAVVGVVIIGLLVWRYRTSKRYVSQHGPNDTRGETYTNVQAPPHNPAFRRRSRQVIHRLGRTRRRLLSRP